MNLIKRESYLKRIRPFYNTNLIKVISGMRRSGKSVLLKQIIEELKDDQIPDSNIIFISLENFINRDLLKDENLYNYIIKKISNEEKYYILIDEIQNVFGFERVINSFQATENCSIFITGSNSVLLSNELSTLLSGRIVKFNILPFKFSEFITFYESSNETTENLFYKYLKWGGIPLVCKIDEESKFTLLESIYGTIVLKDILNRTKTNSVSSLEKVIDFLISNSAKPISGTNISKELNKNGYKVSTPSVYEYIDKVVNACIIDKVPRYDIKGKKILSFEEKVYVKDLGFYSLKKDKSSNEYGAIIETIIYNELIARGYKVYIGKTYKGEVDFVVETNETIFYIQACYLLSNEEIIKREFGAFKNISNNYSKFVISMDKILMNRDGIIHKNLIDFLLEE